ncbi:MAG: tetratricopeptide repeat protein [Flavobacteriales bacterium]|nr:tetratricopeptide repeat protein [Flavobacteriales bacterium]
MKKLGTVFIFSLLSIILLSAQNNALDQLNTANQFYENGEFSEAEQAYKSLLADGYQSDDLHFNLGNSLFKTKQIGPAILHYEKAVKLNPNNEDAAYNLQLANKKTVDKIEAIPELFIYRWWKSIYNLFPADNWAKIMITLLLISLLGFGTFKFTRTVSLKKFGFYVFTSGMVLALMSWGLAASQKSYVAKNTHAIIMESTVDILSAPSAGSSQLFVLHEGTKVKIKGKTEGWFEISLPNGNQGWIETKSLGLI